MKKLCAFWILLMLWAMPAQARDFIVKFIEENYKETQARFSYDPLIYHSIQVNSKAGPKVLILTGDNYNYRNWLRQYIGDEKQFIARIDPERINEFISSKAYEIDVTMLHPVNADRWNDKVEQPEKSSMVKGDDNILIVDPEQRRAGLITSVVKNMGYSSVVFSSAQKALEGFSLEPEKFRMILVHHGIKDIPAEMFVDRILETGHTIPVVIDVGYQNPQVKNRLSSKFSENRSIHFRPAVLRELPKTIEQLLKKSV